MDPVHRFLCRQPRARIVIALLADDNMHAPSRCSQVKGEVAQKLASCGMIGVEVAIEEEQPLHGVGSNLYRPSLLAASLRRMSRCHPRTPHQPDWRFLRRVDDVHVQDHTNLAPEEIEQNCSALLTADFLEQAETVAKCAVNHTYLIT